jgi:citrate lyase subunit beta/citryl-CoA lyase
MVPKAEDAEALSRLASGLGAPVIALVETAVGVLRAPELAAAGGVERLAFGHLDFILDIDATDDASALLLARSTLVLASRAARIYGPIDGVTARLDDVSATLADARVSRKLGFTGKLCLHPRQVSAVHQAYLPSGEEVGWASAIVAEATSGAAARVGGQLVDEPILRRAYRIRERAGLGDRH